MKCCAHSLYGLAGSGMNFAVNKFMAIIPAQPFA